MMEVHMSQLADKRDLKPSQIVSLKVAMAGLQAAWDAVLPRSSAEQCSSALYDPCIVSRRQIPCWYGARCWKLHCPYAHPNNSELGRQQHETSAGHAAADSVPVVAQRASAEAFEGPPPQPTEVASDPVGGRADSAASCTAIVLPPTPCEETQRSNDDLHQISPPCDSREPAVRDTCAQIRMQPWDEGRDNDDNDLELAQAIAMSMQSSSATLPVRRLRQEGPQPTAISGQLCGDCNPPESWTPHFAAGSCSRCRRRVEITFRRPGI